MENPLIEALIVKMKDLDNLKDRVKIEGSVFLNEKWYQNKDKSGSEFDYWRGAHCQVDDANGSRERAKKEEINKIKLKDPGFIALGSNRDVFAKTKYPETLSGLLFFILPEPISNKNLQEYWDNYIGMVKDGMTEEISESCNNILKEDISNDADSFAIKILEDVINFIYKSIDELKGRRAFNEPIDAREIN